MPKIFTALLIGSVTLALSGCGAFYPNWGATGLPESPTSQEATSETESNSPTAQPQASETPTITESATPSQTANSELAQTGVEIIMASVDEGAGILMVVAQMPALMESGGKCILRFISGSVEKSVEVKAEPSSDYTQCFPVEIELSELPRGTGVVTVSYISAEHVGLSKGQSVVIP